MFIYIRVRYLFFYWLELDRFVFKFNLGKFVSKLVLDRFVFELDLRVKVR